MRSDRELIDFVLDRVDAGGVVLRRNLALGDTAENPASEQAPTGEDSNCPVTTAVEALCGELQQLRLGAWADKVLDTEFTSHRLEKWADGWTLTLDRLDKPELGFPQRVTPAAARLCAARQVASGPDYSGPKEPGTDLDALIDALLSVIRHLESRPTVAQEVARLADVAIKSCDATDDSYYALRFLFEAAEREAAK